MALTILLGAAFSNDLTVTDLREATHREARAISLTDTTRWEHESLQCRYNPEGATLDLDIVEAAIVEAGKAWELKSGLKFEYAGTTSESPDSVVYDCLISWDLFADIFKLGTAKNFRIGSNMVGTDIRISRLVGKKRLSMVLTHEIGHGIGLKHNDKGCIMQSSPLSEHLCFSDYASVSELYPTYEVDGIPGLDCTVNLLPNREVFIPSIDGKYWARYHLNEDLSMTYIEHGKIETENVFVCGTAQ